MKKTLAFVLAFIMLFGTCATAMATWSEDSVEKSAEESMAYSKEVSVQVAEEGIVLLKNENSSLPMAEGTKVNVFGASALDPAYAGGGGGNVSGQTVDFYTSLTMAGIEYNEELYNTYRTWYDQYESETPYAGGVVADDGASIWDLSNSSCMNAEWNITTDMYNQDGSLRIARMDNQILENAKAYSQNAIVFITRSGSESSDLSEADLELSEAEVATLSYVTANFENVVVIFNIANMMEMGWLEGGAEFSFNSYAYGTVTGGGCRPTVTTYLVEYDEPHTYTVGACDSAMIIWALGVNGMEAVGEILAGTVNPSGRLADTIQYDISDNPSTQNYGEYFYSDADPSYSNSEYFVTYEEDIYVGYMYYETFAPEKVQFPFGYGLSYTTFDWSDFTYTLGTNKYGEDTVVVKATVTNTGAKAGKDVVEVYYTQPFYNDSRYKVQKALVNLGGFEKTKLLQPDESETVTIELNVRDMASWSSVTSNYILEQGDYTIAVATNANTAHTAPADTFTLTVADGKLNGQTPAAKYIAVDEKGGIQYTADEVTGTEYTRLFADVEGINEVNAVYMQREDVNGVPTVKANTYPVSPNAEDYFYSAIAGNDQYDTYYDIDHPYDGILDREEPISSLDDPDMPAYGVVYKDENGQADPYTIQEMWADIEAGADEDEAWNKLLDQLTPYEMIKFAGEGGFNYPTFEQLGVYLATGNDGPAQVQARNTCIPRDPDFVTTGFPCDVCLCSTWNKELSYKMGEAIGYEAYYIDVAVWYAPGINIHRSPMCGRNFEYFSEDTYLAGTMVSQELRGTREHGGLVAGLKHFMLNQQETHRQAVSTYLSEQALRETYGEAWEIAFREGQTYAIMGAFNRIGYRWVGASEQLCTSLLRDEWGYKGYIVSDFYLGGQAYMDLARVILAGSDTIEENINWNSQAAREALNYFAYDPVGLTKALRENTRHIFNSWSESNGYIEDVEAAIAEQAAGGYQFDNTPDEIGYTDSGWYGTVTVGSDHVIPTEAMTVQIPVTISDNQGVTASIITITSGLRLTIDDPNVLAVNERQTEDGWSYKISYCEIENYMANGEIFTLNIAADENTPNGVYNITITAEDTNDRWAHITGLNTVGGTLIVGDNPKGDVNGDYELTNADLIMIARYLVELVEFDERQMELADFNDDGEVNNTDLVLIARAIVEE